MTKSGPLRDIFAPAVVVLLLEAGYIKASPALAWLPVDLTLLAAVFVAGGSAAALLHTQGRFLPQGLGWMGLLAVAFLLPIAGASSTEYGKSKVTLLLLTLLCALGPMFLITNERRLWWFTRWVVIGGLVATLLAQYFPAPSLLGTVAGAGGTTIGIGRATGAALVGVIVLVLAKKLNVLLALVAAAPLLYALIGSASRGPLVAVSIAAFAGTVIRRGKHRVRDAVFVTAAGVIGIGWAFNNAGTFSQRRILLLFAQDQGTSIDTRYRLLGLAARAGWEQPLGLGWGGFEPLAYPLSYPHNVALEVFAEAGWIPGALLIAVIIVALRRATRASISPAAVGVLALLLFHLVNALVSGDVNDNRALFALVGLSLALPGVIAARTPPESDEAGASPLRGAPSNDIEHRLRTARSRMV